MSETSEKEVDTQSGEPITDYRWKRRDGVLQQVELSVLYHRKRERFFELADRCAKGIAVVFSSAAVVKAAGDGWWFQTAMAFVAVTSAISLVGSFSHRARKHADLANQFGVLGAQLIEHGELLRDDQPLDVCEAKIRLLEATEPASPRRPCGDLSERASAGAQRVGFDRAHSVVETRVRARYQFFDGSTYEVCPPRQCPIANLNLRGNVLALPPSLRGVASSFLRHRRIVDSMLKVPPPVADETSMACSVSEAYFFAVNTDR